ncbi:O-antigen ligase family protein [Desulfovibrio subterraneus]|uniref:O-antigen ligase family protein n=1 Tax=Desulfovibrio subterraneus TaxID=2718620 RepID=UPI0022B92619|nr:O-antigen ligase family protein [Desulfovibrio subterraneus]WBF66153.1 O-antigen ligase family protein [Desulfovibrio subterraneus]
MISTLKTYYTRYTPQQRGAFILALMRYVFLACWLLYPFGKAFQVAGGTICLILLPFYYLNDYAGSNLKKVPGKWLFGLFFLFIFLNTALSGWPAHSFSYLRPTLIESWPMLFAGLEVIRSRKDMLLLGLAFFGAAFGEGLTGIWQYVTGFDLITGDPLMTGRLTGSFGSYRVGNYIAIAILPACLAYYAMPSRWSAFRRLGLVALGLTPPLFLLVGAQARTGMLGLAAGAILVLAIIQYRRWYIIPTGVMLITLGLVFGPSRIALKTAMRDARWELWRAAIEIFKHHPFWGAGASTFKPAYMELGIEFTRNSERIPHPHGAFVQLLADGGIAGFAVVCSFLLGYWGWCALQTIKGLQQGHCRQTWYAAAFIWGGYSCYLGTAVFGHNFYRTWWLAMGMALLGTSIGACLTASAREQVDSATQSHSH